MSTAEVESTSPRTASASEVESSPSPPPSASEPPSEAEEAAPVTTRTTLPSRGKDSTAVIPKSKQHESDELTKRLQKLALERQKESKGERLKVIQNDASQQHLTSAKTFQELNLPAHLLEAIFSMGFDRPSAIQEEALPRILADPPRNLIGQAQSGSGKVRPLRLLYDSPVFLLLSTNNVRSPR
jgi:ATP-dependent RNA helicase DDX19/DBP5